MKKNLVSVVARGSFTPDLWDVTLEKSQGSGHEVVSIICHKHSLHKHPHTYIISFSLLFLLAIISFVSRLFEY